MSKNYRLHYAPDNVSLVIRIALDHVGAPFDTALVDRSARAQQSAAYRALNPLGMIPAMETAQGTLFESGAILLWLSEQHDGLLPAPRAPERGDALKWLFFLSNSLHAQLRQMFYTERFIAEDATPALRAGLAPRVRADFAQIDRLIGEGHSFGTAGCIGLDIYAACLFRFAQLYPAAMPRDWVSPKNYPNLQSLCARLETLSAVKNAQEAEGLGPSPFTAPIHANPPIGSAT